MSANPFKKASKSQAKLRLALMGTSGSGKTFTALTVATALGERVAVIDTEHGSASKYADRFNFDVLELAEFNPQNYIDAISAAAEDGYDVLVIDSLSHAWNGVGGALEMVDKAAKRSQSNNTYTAWRDVTPLHNKLIDAMIAAPLHIITTMRSKTEYVLETNERGKQVPRKVGMAPIQREGMEYEFDLVGDMDLGHTLIISKSRIPALDGEIIPKPDAKLAEKIKAWLMDGAPLHWAKAGGGQRFMGRKNALNLTGEFVMANLEPGRVLERLSDTSLSEAEAFIRLETLAAAARQ